MLEKGVKCPTSWSFVDENIEDVEHINLKPEIQQLLGCTINQFVFLEYPFAYVPAEIVKNHSNVSGSPFENHKDQLEFYKDSTFLIGYASKELISEKFVICLSEEARDKMVKRNREVTMRIHDYVRMKVEKIPRSWRSLGTENDLDSAFLKNARPYYEVEISLPACLLRQHREFSDRSADDVRDGYVEIVPQYEVFENVDMLLISKAVQTHLIGQENSVQTYPGHPKNEWTQYEYDCFPKEERPENGEDEEEKEKEKSEESGKTVSKESSQEVHGESETSEEIKLKKATSLELFLEDHIEEMVDVIRYNTVINLHTDDISNLAQGVVQEPRLSNLITYKERVSLINLIFSKRRVISNVSWHPSLNDVVAICYVESEDKEVLEPELKLLTENQARVNNFDDNDNNSDNFSNYEVDSDDEVVDNKSEDNSSSFGNDDNDSEDIKDEDVKENNYHENGALIWSLSDYLHPKMILSNQYNTQVVSFCPYKPDILIGGSSNGQIIIWDLRSLLNFDETSKGTPIISPIALSNKETSHNLPIRSIRWLPSWYEVRIDGSLQKSPGKSIQFATASDDGSLAIWDLRWQANSRPPSKARKTNILESFDPKKLNGVLRPVYQIMIQLPKESLRFSPLSICLPLIKGEDQTTKELDTRTNELLKRFLVATLEGEFINCSWEGQDFGTETSNLEKCNFLSRSCIHDGPVLEISRCPFLDDVILTIGGRIFAIWKDDYLDSPLLWRTTSSSYTSCCWSSRPGIFLLARCDGELEVWEITRKTYEPVLSQFISSGPITGLYPCLASKIIGICDYNGAFRTFTEPEESEDESLERIEWFEEFVWREIKRKRHFFLWESDFLKTNPKAVERKKTRAAEEIKRKHQEARDKFLKEQEEFVRQEAERKARMIKKSKGEIWKSQDHERMKKILLNKKGFVPKELEKSRLPLVVQQRERISKIEKAKQETCLKEKYFKDIVSTEFPRVEKKNQSNDLRNPIIKRVQNDMKNYKEEFVKIRDEARKQLNESPYVPKFDWNNAMKEGKRRQLTIKMN